MIQNNYGNRRRLLFTQLCLCSNKCLTSILIRTVWVNGRIALRLFRWSMLNVGDHVLSVALNALYSIRILLLLPINSSCGDITLFEEAFIKPRITNKCLRGASKLDCDNCKWACTTIVLVTVMASICASHLYYWQTAGQVHCMITCNTHMSMVAGLGCTMR